MRVFIAWSGERSRGVAVALRDWLKKLIQSVEPWMPEEDISDGARGEEAAAIEDAQMVVVCLTPENRQVGPLHEEAAAVSGAIAPAFVCPYLLGLEPAEVSGPLARFPARKADRDGTLALIRSLNAHPELAEPLSPADLREAFELWWPKLEAQLRLIPAPSRGDDRAVLEIVTEILQIVRQLAKQRRGPANQSPEAPVPQEEQPAPTTPVQCAPSVLRLLMDSGVVFPPPAPRHVLLAVEQRAPGRLVYSLQDKDILALSVAYVVHGRWGDGVRALAALLGCTELGARGLLEQVRAVAAQAGISLPRGER